MYAFEIRKLKGKLHVIRVWHDGWFPINPFKGLDFKKDTYV